MPKKPVKKRKPASGSSRRPSAKRPPIVRPKAIESEEMLSEFSDEYNDFYVDERRERKVRRKAEIGKQRKAKQVEKRKPISPTRRKLIGIISSAAIIAVVLIVGVVLSLTVLFKTQAYEVTGSTKYTDAEIIEACGIGKGENIFLAPKSPAEKRVKKAFPYIEEVHVGFQIPDTIKIGIIEADEGYIIKVTDAEYLIISTKGRILNRVADRSGYDLPLFIGPKITSGDIGDYAIYEDETVVTMIDNITQTFADNGYQGITEIDATNTADISFTYDDRIIVKLGIPEDLSYKIRTAMTIINENLDKNQTGAISGVLDVSRCNSTKRSYFNEQDIHPTEAPTQDPSQPAAASPDYGANSSYGGEGENLDWEYDYYDENGYGYFF